MTLEDFFTLSEMKIGLTTLARVEELIGVMQRLAACAPTNACDAARQWSTVARTLSLTEDQNCLSHFVFLNGLCFLSQWLLEAVNFSQDSTDAVELINILLGSLEKLPAGWNKLNGSGILLTVKKLCCHTTADVKAKAQILFERWNSERVDNDGCEDLEKGCLGLAGSLRSSTDSTKDNTKNGDDQKAVEEGSCSMESCIPATSSKSLQSDTANENLKLSLLCQTMPDSSFSELTDKCSLLTTTTALYVSSCERNLPVECSSVAPAGIAAPSGTPTSPEVLLKDGDKCVASVATTMPNPVETNPSGVSIVQGNELGNSSANVIRLINEATDIANEDDQLLNDSTLKECEQAEEELCSGYSSETSKLKINKKLNKKSDTDHESVDLDALELARQVAIEVEREVVDYREKSCSSSNETTNGDKQNYLITGEPIGNGSMSRNNDSNIASSHDTDNCKFSELTDDLRKVTGMDRNVMLRFDLNEDPFSENFDCAMNSITKGPVDASAAIAPAHFKGELGRTDSDSKQKKNQMEIDLNVAECGSDAAMEAAAPKELLISYCVPSRDSSIEVSSGRPTRMQLDLNCVADDEAPSLQSSLMTNHRRRRSRSPSPISSSSSKKRSMKSFDLNDSLVVLDGVGFQSVNTLNSTNAYGAGVNDRVFTIMGSKIVVGGRDRIDQNHRPYNASGLNWGAVSAGGSLMPCMHQVPQPSFRCNGLEMAPAPIYSFQPAHYEHSHSTLPLLMSMTSTPSSLNGVEPSNAGQVMNSGSRDQFLVPANGVPFDEQMKASSQHSTSRIQSSIRRELSSGWDSCDFGCSKVTSWP